MAKKNENPSLTDVSDGEKGAESEALNLSEGQGDENSAEGQIPPSTSGNGADAAPEVEDPAVGDAQDAEAAPQVASPTVGDVEVTAIRRYHGAEGYKRPGHPSFFVAKLRAAELLASGLVVEGKVAPTVANKMAPDPDSKAKK